MFFLVVDHFRPMGTHRVRDHAHVCSSMSFRTLQWNDAPRPFVWKKTAEEILDSLARYLQRISGGEH